MQPVHPLGLGDYIIFRSVSAISEGVSATRAQSFLEATNLTLSLLEIPDDQDVAKSYRVKGCALSIFSKKAYVSAKQVFQKPELQALELFACGDHGLEDCEGQDD